MARSDDLLSGGSAELERLQPEALVWEPKTRWLGQIGGHYERDVQRSRSLKGAFHAVRFCADAFCARDLASGRQGHDKSALRMVHAPRLVKSEDGAVEERILNRIKHLERPATRGYNCSVTKADQRRHDVRIAPYRC